MNKTNKQILGFMISGFLSTLLMYVLYLFFYKITTYQLAYFFSYSISVIALYFMNLVVFKASMSLDSILKFPLIYAFQYLVGAFTLELFVHQGVSILLAPILVFVTLFPITYLFNKLIF